MLISPTNLIQIFSIRILAVLVALLIMNMQNDILVFNIIFGERYIIRLIETEREREKERQRETKRERWWEKEL